MTIYLKMLHLCHLSFKYIYLIGIREDKLEKNNMFPEDENQNHPEENNSHEMESDETTIEDFLDKFTVTKKEKKTVFITKHDNNSGEGEEAPESIAYKFNWGAFLFNWIWAVKYKKWWLLSILVMLFIPYGYIPAGVLCLWAGMKGNQWAWEEVQYESEEDFHQAQKKWVKAWFGIVSVLVVVGLIVLSSMPKQKQVEAQESMTSFTSTPREMKIPNEVYKNTTTQDRYSDLLNSDKYIIYWVRYKNDFENSNLEFIQNKMAEKTEAVKDRFMLIPNLIEIRDASGNVIESQKNIQMRKYDLKPHCENVGQTCFEGWLYENCYNRYCVINPQTRAYIKVGGKKNVVPQAIKASNRWNLER